jgi:hypothetical protein
MNQLGGVFVGIGNTGHTSGKGVIVPVGGVIAGRIILEDIRIMEGTHSKGHTIIQKGAVIHDAGIAGGYKRIGERTFHEGYIPVTGNLLLAERFLEMSYPHIAPGAYR